jgi:hypothetical protein
MDMDMADEQKKEDPIEDPETQIESDLPIGIARLHDEWSKQGLGVPEPSQLPQVGLEPVVFPEPVGDYKVPAEDARAKLGLSFDAMERLLTGGGLDSILVKFDDGIRRMISESALARFVQDSGMDPAISESLSTPAKELAAALEAIHQELAEMRDHQSRQLQQFKDILLLELRNLKEQDRDLTSFIYDMTAALEEVFPKLKKRRRTQPPGEAAG